MLPKLNSHTGCFQLRNVASLQQTDRSQRYYMSNSAVSTANLWRFGGLAESVDTLHLKQIDGVIAGCSAGGGSRLPVSVRTQLQTSSKVVQIVHQPFEFEPGYDCENDKSYFQPEWFPVVNHDAKMFRYLKDFQQGFHVKSPDAEGNSEDSRHNNEDQQEGEPHCKRDSQQDAQQVVERVEEELHLKVRRGQTSFNSLKPEGRRLHYISWPKMALHEDHNRGRVLLKLNLKQMANLASSSWSRSWIAIFYGFIKNPNKLGWNGRSLLQVSFVISAQPLAGTSDVNKETTGHSWRSFFLLGWDQSRVATILQSCTNRRSRRCVPSVITENPSSVD